MEYLIFTDLDGTLLDNDTYSYEDALPGLRILKRERIPLVFCSSKTRAEQELLRRELEINDPFIVENGAAVYVEKDYFRLPEEEYSRTEKRYQVLEFGQSYATIREVLNEINSELPFSVTGYGDLTPAEVSTATGLSPEVASAAMERQYEETLLTQLNQPRLKKLETALAPYDLTVSKGGRFYAVKGKNNKGQAAIALTQLYRKERGEVITVGIGDSGNDLTLLSAVYVPVLVQRPGGYFEDLDIDGIKRVKGVGPEGWTRAVEKLLNGELLVLKKKSL